MKKTRQYKGYDYWFLDEYLDVVDTYEHNTISDNSLFEVGNYFLEREEAESMARKLRAVLNGADVIEMPSKIECTDAADEHIELCREECFPYQNEDEARAAFCNGIEWLKSKIVK